MNLPIGILLPTRDPMAHLPGHLRDTAAWLDAIQEVVVVDCDSKDGTIEFLRANLRHPNLRILAHPPAALSSILVGTDTGVNRELNAGQGVRRMGQLQAIHIF